MRADQVIIEPVLTEKANAMREAEEKKYAFRVDPRANKQQIMQAVAQLFSVKPVACNVVQVKAKPKQSRTRSGVRSGSTAPWKKAIVTLTKGDSIEMIDGA